MNVRAWTAPPQWAGLRAQTRDRWNALAVRERAAVAVAMLLVAAFAVWSLAVGPAWHTVRNAPAELDVLEAQLQQMQRLGAEAAAMRSAAPVSPAQATAALKAATDRLGDQGRIVFQGDRATLTLTGASGEALRAWLSEARSAARARAIDVQLTRTPPGYSGTVVVNVGTAA